MIFLINNAGLFSEPSLNIFTKGANNSDHDCIYYSYSGLPNFSVMITGQRFSEILMFNFFLEYIFQTLGHTNLNDYNFYCQKNKR